MNMQEQNNRNSDLEDPKKKKNPEPGKQKPLTVEKEHVVEDPKKDKRVRIVSKKKSEAKSDYNQNSSEPKGTGNIGLNSENTIT